MSTLATETGPRTAVTAAALAAALASAGFIAGIFLLHDRTNAEAAKAPVTVVECLIAGLAFVALTVSLPRLARDTRLPEWALTGAAVACAFVAIEAWAFGSVAAHIANEVPAQFDDLGKPTFLLLLLSLPAMIACPLAFTTLAVVGWRRGAMPRGACVLLVLGGLTALATATFPPVGVLAGIALAWTARSAARSYA